MIDFDDFDFDINDVKCDHHREINLKSSQQIKFGNKSMFLVAMQMSVHDCNDCAHKWRINCFSKVRYACLFFSFCSNCERAETEVVAKTQHAVLPQKNFPPCNLPLLYSMHAIQTHYAKYA